MRVSCLLLNYMNLSDNSELMSAAKQCPQLHTLSLAHNAMTDKNVYDIAAAVGNTKIVSLDISFNPLTHVECVFPLFGAPLCVLGLNGLNITRVWDKMCAFLAANKRLPEVVSLENNGLQDSHVMRLLVALNTDMRILRLGNNDLTNASLCACAKGERVESLFLDGHVLINDHGLSEISAFVHHNTKLKHLCLENCAISKEGEVWLSKTNEKMQQSVYRKMAVCTMSKAHASVWKTLPNELWRFVGMYM
jgi:Leucine-rich repeat (LRR) protein